MLTSQNSPILIGPTGHIDNGGGGDGRGRTDTRQTLGRRYNAVTAAQTLRLRPHFPRLTNADAGLVAALLRRYDLDETVPFLPKLLAAEFLVTAQAMRLRLSSAIRKGILRVINMELADFHTSGSLRRITVRIIEFTDLAKSAIRDAMAEELLDPATDSNATECVIPPAGHPTTAEISAQSSAHSSAQRFAQTSAQNTQQKLNSLMKYKKDRKDSNDKDDFSFEKFTPVPIVVEEDVGSYKIEGEVIVVTPSKAQQLAGATTKRLPLDFEPLLERGLSGTETISLMSAVKASGLAAVGLSVQLLWFRFSCQAAFKDPTLRGRRLFLYLNKTLEKADKNFVKGVLAEQRQRSEWAAFADAQARASEYAIGSVFTVNDGRTFEVTHATWVEEVGDATKTQHRITSSFLEAVVSFDTATATAAHAPAVAVAVAVEKNEFSSSPLPAKVRVMDDEQQHNPPQPPVKKKDGGANQDYLDSLFALLKLRKSKSLVRICSTVAESV